MKRFVQAVLVASLAFLGSSPSWAGAAAVSSGAAAASGGGAVAAGSGVAAASGGGGGAVASRRVALRTWCRAGIAPVRGLLWGRKGSGVHETGIDS